MPAPDCDHAIFNPCAGSCHPSGLTALSLDGASRSAAGRSVRVEAVLFPVRFEDFDAGLVEDFLGPQLRSGVPELIVTLSMGREV